MSYKIISKENSEGRMELTIQTKEKKTTVAFPADVHNNFEYLRTIVKQIKSHPDWLVVINGDLWDADQYSSHPTTKVTPLQDAVEEAISIMRPIFPQMIAFVWGNHEERCFRSPSGKGVMPNPFQTFFQAWQAVNSNAIVCEPMRSLILVINGKRILVKHGHSAGKNLGELEYREVLTNNEAIDVIVLSHVHIPDHKIIKRADKNDPRLIHLVRTTAGVEFLPYQDKSNLYISPAGLTRITFTKLPSSNDVHVDEI